MTPHQRARRAEEVIEARARGLRALADHHRTARHQRAAGTAHLLRRRRERLVPADRDALEMATELLEQYEAVIEEFALLAEATAHDGVRLGAIRSRLDAMVSRAQLLMALGILPHDLGQLRLVVEARAVAQTTLRVLQEHAVASPELPTP